ncbi:MAG: zinc ABC transporter substrate-binding protein [Myxococcota bacterium]|nr:zinc ABC transporter substrate-binding protein [Myxococcota bacterium]
MLPRLARRELAAVVLGGLLGACGAEEPRDDRPLVVVSVAPQRFLVKAVAGELARVEVMIPPGANPRSHEPTTGQLRALEEAALYVKVGHSNFPFEQAWLERLLAEVPGLPVVDASAGLSLPDGDPHVWLAPRHAEHMAVQTASALERIFPGQRELLRRNLAAFRERVTELDREIERRLENLDGAEFFVFHPAWGYFAEAYGLRQVAIEHEHKEPDPHELAELIERAKKAKARVIFVQPQFDPTSAKTVARETGARVEILDPLAEDWDANLRRAARALAEGLAP